MICEADKADLLYRKILEIRNDMRGDFEVKPPSDRLFDEFKDFDIIREDDLTEMVWGLQGAGKAFIEVEKEREEKRKQRLLKGISQELISISERLMDIRSGHVYSGFRTLCIENFLKEPPIGKGAEELLKNLSDLCDMCRETNDIIRTDDKNEKQIINENVEKIESLVREIKKKIGEIDEKTVI